MKSFLGWLIGIILSILLIVFVVASSLSIPLFLIFLILKLCGVIAWSWFLVCLPLIVGIVALILYAVIRVVLEVI